MERTSTRGNAPPRAAIRARRRRLKKRSLLLITLVAGLFAWTASMSGCGRPEEDAAAPRPPSTRPATVANVPPPPPTTQPADPATPPSTLYFTYNNGDGQEALGAAAENPPTPWGVPKALPAARLMLTDKKDGPVTARLFSDDPEEALSPKWAGDRFYMEMRLHADSIAQLDGECWGVTASNGELPETTNGVYLMGDRYHLVPVDVVVVFEGQAPKLHARVTGRFLQIDTTDPRAAPKSVVVQAQLMPRVEVK